MNKNITDAIKNFECRRCDSIDKLSTIKEKYGDVVFVEMRCLGCREKETLII